MNDTDGSSNEVLHTSVSDDPELTQPDGTLYEREFWGISRHELIAGTAEAFLAANAKAEVERILAPVNQVMADLGGWADRVKNRRPNEGDDPDTAAFLSDARNRNNGPWHYVNLPLDAEEYSRERYPAFTRDDDVVQIIGEGVRVLMGNSDRFSELNALRLVTHLVGDVHQPIHVGCCFIDKSDQIAKLVGDPDVAAEMNLQSDRGGNNLILPIGNSGVSLHAYWDSRLGGSGAGGGGGDDHDHDADEDEDEGGLDFDEAEGSLQEDEPVDPELKNRFILKLREMVADDLAESDATVPSGEADPIPLDQWAVQWATESLVQARKAYQSLEIKGKFKNKQNQFAMNWEGRQTYDARCKPIVDSQMKLAAKNLAALLNAIWP
jgi:hypothetical protein